MISFYYLYWKIETIKFAIIFPLPRARFSKQNETASPKKQGELLSLYRGRVTLALK